jgi:glycosyltransferase involved in cell wall biosynthesis
MRIRSHSWGDATISWSLVVEELLSSAKKRGHETYFITTNGYKGMKYLSPKDALEQEMVYRSIEKSKEAFDIDLTYTAPQNFPQRFLKNSKNKMAIYAYESSIMPKYWSQFYKYVDFMLPPSKYCADMMKKNGCPPSKIKVVPHGIHLHEFLPQGEVFNLKTDKKYKFLCIGEPHYRKQIDKLLTLYCKEFTIDDDVTFVLKTKIFLDSQQKSKMTPFEMDILSHLVSLKKIFGKKMPEVKVIGERIKDISSLYRACDAFVLMTAGEGWCMPYLEALACGIPVVAPNYGGQLEYLSESNSFLTKCSERAARTTEQYWQSSPGARIGNPDENEFALVMRNLYNGRLNDEVFLKKAEGLKTAEKFTWDSAFAKIEEICR